MSDAPVLQFEESAPESARESEARGSAELDVVTLPRSSSAKIVVSLLHGRLVRVCGWYRNPEKPQWHNDTSHRGILLPADEIPYLIDALRAARDAAIAAGWKPRGRSE